MHLSEDGHTHSGRNMQEEYYVCNIRNFYTFMCIVGLVTIRNCSVHGHGLFKIDKCHLIIYFLVFRYNIHSQVTSFNLLLPPIIAFNYDRRLQA